MRPLYIEGRAPTEVLLDGPGLVVRRSGRADGRYPLQRLSRVMVSGEVRCATEALLACLRQGVSVVFLDAAGQALGVCMGTANRRLTLYARLYDLFDAPGWEACYENWWLAAERRAILSASREAHVRFLDLRPEPAVERLMSLCAGHGRGQSVPAALARLEGLAVGLVSGHLSATGLRLSQFADARRGMRLVLDLARLLLWDLRALLCNALARDARLDLGPAALARAFETRSPRLRKLAHLYLLLLDRATEDLVVSRARRRAAGQGRDDWADVA